MEWKIPLTEPALGEEEIEAVTRVLRSKWLTMGAVTAEFEKKFAEKMNVKHAIAVTNCTAALHLANVALGIGPGDEVICPNLTFVATANASRYTGANVVFADVISEKDPTISPTEIEKKVTGKTKAVTVVHYAGFPCAMDEIQSISRKHNLKIIEDCAHSPFAKYSDEHNQKKYVGSIGDVGCFSFFGNKNMTTGEGGMITTNDDSVAGKIRLLRSHGMTTLTYDRHSGHARSYDVVELGYNYRIDEIRSAIGLCQLTKIDTLNRGRRSAYSAYVKEFAGYDRAVVPFADRNVGDATPHILPLFLDGDIDRLREVLKDNGVQSSKHYEFVNSFKIYGNEAKIESVIRNDKLITVPLSPCMAKEDVKHVVDLVKGCL